MVGIEWRIHTELCTDMYKYTTRGEEEIVAMRRLSLDKGTMHLLGGPGSGVR